MIITCIHMCGFTSIVLLSGVLIHVMISFMLHQVKQLLEQNISLKKNISSLFRTAKTELTNKNDQISMLQARWATLLCNV